MEALPQGKIFGMTVTQPCSSPPRQSSPTTSVAPPSSNSSSSDQETSKSAVSPNNSIVSQSAIDMLASLFPHRKRSVLELILRRCDLDLLRAIEQCSGAPSAFRPPVSSQVSWLYICLEVTMLGSPIVPSSREIELLDAFFVAR